MEAGEGLDAETISDYWYELNEEYYGSEVDMSENMRYRWASIPHLYYEYYVYKYATSITYAGIITDRIENGEEGIIDKYLYMLTLGASMKPSDLLKEVDIDPTDLSTYETFATMYEKLIDEYEELLVKTGRIGGENE